MTRILQKNYLIYLSLIIFTGILSTVFIVESNSTLWKGVITAKYFWFAAVMCLVPVLFLFQRFIKHEIHITDILFYIFYGYIVINWFCKNGHPDIRWWLTLLILPLYAAIRLVSANVVFRRWFSIVFLFFVLTEAVWGLLQLYGVTHSYHYIYKVTGSLFNSGPFSGFVAVGVPLALAYAFDKSVTRWEKRLGLITLPIVLLALIFSMSRAAWLASVASCSSILWKQFQSSKLQFQIVNSKFFKSAANHFSPFFIRILMVIATGFLIIILLAGTYLIKKNSADGRWLIWNVSMEAVKQHPVFGAGYGRFAVVYGDAQREYFLSGIRNEKQAIVADSSEYAFNEFVQIIVELGGFGLLFFMLLTGSLLVSRRTSFSSYHASFISFLVFAFFSYPFRVLPLVIIFLFLLALLAPSSKKISFNLPVWFHTSSMVVFIGAIAYGTFQIFSRQKMYRKWTMAQTVYYAKAYQQIYPEYSSLYPYLRHEKQFLFEYGQCLSNADKYAESNHIFEEYLFYGSDPMVFNCMGNNFKAMGEYGKAEEFYIRSSQTVPNRHYPIYLLMKLYVENGQTEKAKAIAGVLLAKPVKIKSTAIQEMRDYAIKVVDGD